MIPGIHSVGTTAEGDGSLAPIVTVSIIRAASWNTRKTISVTRSGSWKVRKVISLTRVASWGVRKKVSVVRAASWNVSRIISVSRSVSWNSQKLVSLARSTFWGVRKQISIVRSATWNDVMTPPPPLTVTSFSLVKRGDFGYKLRFLITVNGSVPSLVGRPVWINLVKVDGLALPIKRLATVISQSAVTDPNVEYLVQDGDFSLSGAYRAEFEIHYPDGSIATSPSDDMLKIVAVADLG
jgi:hypothetical protein